MKLLQVLWVFATGCRLGLYPTLIYNDDWSRWGLNQLAMIPTLYIGWEIPEDVFDSHWNAPWNHDHGIPF